MKNLVPIKVKIGYGKVGNRKQHIYPAFNNLQSVKDSGMDWSEYVDVEGLGWHYDNCCGHKTETPESPFGQQFGVLIVPKAFADEAVAAFSGTVTKLTELELEDFYDNHAHKHEADEEIDTDIVTGIKLKQDLGIALTQSQLDSLNPDNEMPGIRKNKRKTWAEYKKVVNVVIVQ